jgi:hypothetical protein
MTAEQYLEYLEIYAQDEHVKLALRPVQMSQIFELVAQLKIELPKQYETFLTTVGCGEECGGMGLWYHLDLTSPGSVLERSRGIPSTSPAKGMLAIYDSYDGDIYGFLPGKRSFRPQVHALNTETNELHKVADNFEDFLDCLTGGDVDDEEIDLAFTP